MSGDKSGAGSGSVIPFPANPAYVEYTVKRDKDSPFVFWGVKMAEASETALLVGAGILKGAVYRTRGGKYITTFSKLSMLDPDLPGRSSGYNKAAVHDTFEAAMDWFRPGLVTERLRQQLGLDKPIRIE
jgi:hypothetical protein